MLLPPVLLPQQGSRAPGALRRTLSQARRLAGGGEREHRRAYGGAYWAIRARARTGEPVPETIFRGAAMRTAPLGGSWSSWQRLARP